MPFCSLPATFEQRQNIENLLKHYKCGELIRMFSVTEPSIKNALKLLLDSAEYQDGIISVSNDISKHLINRKLSSITAADYIEELLSNKKCL